jgi:hypothetical protein
MYFIYGMNDEIEKKILEEYFARFPDLELRMIVKKL